MLDFIKQIRFGENDERDTNDIENKISGMMWEEKFKKHMYSKCNSGNQKSAKLSKF
jgi:hypothetical protein